MKTLTADRRMIKIAMEAPYLERDEEHKLAQAWRNDNDQEARNTVLAYQTLTPEGRVIRNPTIKSQERDYKFMPKYAKQVDRKVVIIPTLYRNSLCFARLEFAQ